MRLVESKLLSVSTNITVETIAQINPAIATVVNFGVSGLHLKDTEKMENPTADKIPNKRPKNVPLLVLPKAIIIIAFGNTNKGSIFGLLFGILSAVGFSVFSVSLRWRPETPKFTTVAIAGLICAIVSTVILVETDSNLISSSRNQGLFSVHGTLVCVGLILYSLGSRMIPAAELTLLSLTEVIGGIFWVWLPILGINEVPTNNTIIGGFLIFISIIYYSLIIKNNRRFIALN